VKFEGNICPVMRGKTVIRSVSPCLLIKATQDTRSVAIVQYAS